MLSAVIWLALTPAAWRVSAEDFCAQTDEPACFIEWAKSGGDFDLVGAELKARLAATAEPDGGEVSLALAELALLEEKFEDLREGSSAALRRCFFAANVDCQLRARRLLAYALSWTDRLNEAIWEAEKAHALALQIATGREQFKTGVTLARLRLSGLVDLGRVAQLLDQIETVAPLADPSDLLYFRSTRAGLLDHLGYLDRAAISYAQVRDLALAQGNSVVAASEEFNRVDSLVKSGSLQTSPSQLAAAVSALKGLLEEAQTPMPTRLRSLALLAQIDPDRASDYLGECLQIATDIDDPRSMARCAGELALSVMGAASEDPKTAFELIEIGRRAAGRSGHPNSELEVSRAQMALLWQTQPAERALQESLELLVAEERRRDRQTSPARQLEFLGFLNEDHYWLAARIAAHVADGRLPADRLERALGLLEAVRARQRAGASPVEALDTRLLLWRNAISALGEPGRRSWDARSSAAFMELESMPELLQSSNRRESSRVSNLDFAAIRRTLESDQAILYFQWLPSSGDRSFWAYVLTTGTVHSLAVANSGAVELALARLNSSVRRQHSAEFLATLEQLYDALLAPALADLPSIRRLIVIPDAALFSVPLQALKRFDSRLAGIEVYPSIAAWMRDDGRRGNDRTLRIFANPELPPHNAPTGTGIALQRLPKADEEAQALEALFGDRAQVARGVDASESNALAALSSTAGVVHFAGHVVLNAGNPEASALVLAADGQNDGWLTLDQISQLKIPPKIIVLSACEAASGRMLTGEGLIGLSSGFLTAGARAVLANLWPIDDAHAAEFIHRSYTYLEAGESLESAVSGAGADLARAGYPPTAWAGWTVIGDGAGTLQERSWKWVLALLAGIALIMLALALVRYRETAAGSP